MSFITNWWRKKRRRRLTWSSRSRVLPDSCPGFGRLAAARFQDTRTWTRRTNRPGRRTIDVPGETAGWFAADNADSVFEFSAKEGQQFAIDIVSQRLGESTDARLIIQRIEPQPSGPPKLHDLVNVDDSQSVGDAALSLNTKDPVALFKCPGRREVSCGMSATWTLARR